MNGLIYSYNKTNIDNVSKFLIEYRDVHDYRHFFSSREWLKSFVDVYAPKENFFIQSKNTRNYFSLSAFDNQIVFTGDPFNDFNGVYIRGSDDAYDFKEIIEYLIHLGYKIKWASLFEKNLLVELRTHRKGILQEIGTGMKIPLHENIESYDYMISDRILKMYKKFFEHLSFSRAFGGEMNDNPHLLAILLSRRRKELLAKKSEEYNLSFEPKFDEFITRLVSYDSLWGNVFLDYCVDKERNEIVAMSLNFISGRDVMCYLRAHMPFANKVSYGLVLDYWSNTKNFHEKARTIDLTRGTEPYKYRLGAREYYFNIFEA